MSRNTIERAYKYAVMLYRLVNPVPPSPLLAPGQNPGSLTLIPATAFQNCIERVIRLLQSFSSGPVRIYVEFGVYNGTSMAAAYRAFEAAGIHDAHLIGFDSFEGLPAKAALEDRGVWHPGQFACPMATTIAGLGVAGVPADRYSLTPGWFEETLTAERRAMIAHPVSIVLIDSDAYSSARDALSFVHPCLADESVILFDDWRLNDLDLWDEGEKRAYQEFLVGHPEFRSRRIRSYSRKSSAFRLSRTKQ